MRGYYEKRHGWSNPDPMNLAFEDQPDPAEAKAEPSPGVCGD